MATEAQDKPKSESAAEAPKAQSVVETPKAAPAESKQQAVQAAPAAESTKSGPRRTTVDATEDIPDDADLIEMTPRALKSRMDRFTKKQLKDTLEQLGVSSMEELQAKQARLKSLEEREEEQRRSALDEKTRLEEDVRKQRDRADAAELRYRQTHEQRIVEREENRITNIAAKHIDADYIEEQLPKLAKWLNTNYTQEEMRKLGDDAIEKWFVDLIDRKPKFAREYESRRVVEQKVPLTNGVSATRPEAQQANAQVSSKTYAPNKVNSMSREEAKAAAAREGYRW